MKQAEFDILSQDLRQLASKIPLSWGRIQTNDYDRLINMFAIGTYAGLETALAPFDNPIKQYFRRRWYVWQCSRCDEYLFALNDNVAMNPDAHDKSYDICLNGDLKFDIKGTVIPRELRDDPEGVIANPQPMVDFFYNRQSPGVRYGRQNRLFIVHHSFVDPARELYLRSAWEAKQAIYSEYARTVAAKTNFFPHTDLKADVIFILEREPGETECVIAG